MEWVQRGKNIVCWGMSSDCPVQAVCPIFEGDDFKGLQALRFINPSPYLFYFDFNNFTHYLF